MKLTNTIFALASAHGRAGVAVIRVSGDQSAECLKILTGKEKFEPRFAYYCTLRDGAGQEIDHSLVLWFPGPKSFTGEDVAEFHVHGGRAVVEAVCQILSSVEGVRPAGPGEFSRRAVEHGKLDLTQAEGIADLVDAETEAQRKQALTQYDGALGSLYEGWRQHLIRVAANGEAAIEFGEEDIPPEVLDRAKGQAAEICREIQSHLDDGRRGEIVREGLSVALIGPPNAGKSSLLNALAQREVAIVSSQPGTTRDIVEVRLNLSGFAVILADTAGLRETEEMIEEEGVRRALARAGHADLVLRVLDGSDPHAEAQLAQYNIGGNVLTVWNKRDLDWPKAHEGLCVSVKKGLGIDQLVAAIATEARNRLDKGGVSLTRPRHRYCLQEAVGALLRAANAPEAELFAEDVRLALRAIGRITGVVDVEDILDVVFKDFCIGK